jgi:flagellar hook-length control protein FliK
MDFGFIQLAAPASQPGPLADPSVAVDLSKDAAAAFDAALAATLGPADAKTDQAAANGRAGQPAWLFTSLFAPTVTAFDIATVTAPAAGEIAPAESEDVPAGLSAGPTSSDDELLELPVNIAVPVPVIAEIKNPVLPQGLTNGAAPAAAGTAVAGEQTLQNPAGAAALPQPRAFAAAPEAASSERQPAERAAAAAPAVVTQTAAMGNAPIQAAAAAQAAPVATAVETTKATVDQPAASEASAGIDTDRRDAPQAHASVKADAARPEFADKATQRTETVPQHAPAAAVANAVAAVAEPAAPQAASAATARNESAESAAVPRTVVAWQAHAGQDAATTGQEQQQHGQNRQSPEFTRFAAALAQVTSAAGDDGGRAAAAVVTPAASTAPAAGVPATAAPAPAAAATTATSTPDAENVGRLVQAMRVISRPGAWEATVRLKPEHFGDVSIAVRVERNTVSAVVNAEAAGVCEWLESQEQAVRNGMAEHGLQLDRYVVQRDGQRREPQQQEQETPRHRPRRTAAPTERFEIVV